MAAKRKTGPMTRRQYLYAARRERERRDRLMELARHRREMGGTITVKDAVDLARLANHVQLYCLRCARVLKADPRAFTLPRYTRVRAAA